MTGFRRALLLEDEPNLAQALELSLRKLGIPEVRQATTLAAVRELWREFKAHGDESDIVFLDRMLSDGDGLEFCRELRASGFRGKILVLTASGHIEARVEGLDAGADDYLPKPFSWEELEARVRALARRGELQVSTVPAEPSAEKLWDVDTSRNRVLGPKGWVQMTPLEFKLVTKLLNAPERVVSRDELLKDVWGFKWLPRTRTVDYFMGRVRKNFETEPENPRHFVTVRGVGYRFDP